MAAAGERRAHSVAEVTSLGAVNSITEEYGLRSPDAGAAAAGDTGAETKRAWGGQSAPCMRATTASLNRAPSTPAALPSTITGTSPRLAWVPYSTGLNSDDCWSW